MEIDESVLKSGGTLSKLDHFSDEISQYHPESSARAHLKVFKNGNVMKVQKTRQRKILSCVYCHSKKIKCSRKSPICNNCEKTGIQCQYFVNERISRGGKKKNTSKSDQKSDQTSIYERSSATSTNNLAFEEITESSQSANETTFNKSSHSVPSETNFNGSSPLSKSTTERLDVASSEGRSFSSSSADGEVSPASVMENAGNPNIYMNSNTNSTDIAVLTETGPFDKFDPFSSVPSPSSILQTPIMNVASNNITNNFFNGTSKSQDKKIEEPAFNLSSFTYKSENSSIKKKISTAYLSTLRSSSNTSNASSSNTANDADNSKSYFSTLNNPLSAFSSNPATVVNYLFGTNTSYGNSNLIDELKEHLPESKERSYELVDRYINSVHLLLPILVNLEDFLRSHHLYWRSQSSHTSDDRAENSENSSSSRSSVSTFSSHEPELDYLQFFTLYFPVLYASTISEFEEYDNLLLNQDISKYLKGFNKICQYYNYPHGLRTIPLLLGNVIIQSTSPNPSAMEMSQIIRYAKLLQLHKDPMLTLGIDKWQVIKFRRLLWWTIFGLDALTSHNFCLAPHCRIDNFNVLFPDDEEPTEDQFNEKKLNIGILSINIKFRFDRILSELVYYMHNGLSNEISPENIQNIKSMIVELATFIDDSITRIDHHSIINPPSSIQETNLLNFIKNHSWTYADRALMILHKIILMNEPVSSALKVSRPYNPESALQLGQSISQSMKTVDNLSLSQYEDTFGHIREINIIENLNNSSISSLKFNQFDNFCYEDIQTNLIPSVLHNLNDFLKYNDFIKLGKFNWYIKRTIPLDSIILMLIIICVKFKYDFMTLSELCIYTKLINKALFIINRKWFKNEKYKRMLSLTGMTWEFILKRYNIVNLISQFIEKNGIKDSSGNFEYFEYQISNCVNLNELFNPMTVPQPIIPHRNHNYRQDQDIGNDDVIDSLNQVNNQLAVNSFPLTLETKTELARLNEKIQYDLRNNHVDVNDYCDFYSSNESILFGLMSYINDQ